MRIDDEQIRFRKVWVAQEHRISRVESVGHATWTDFLSDACTFFWPVNGLTYYLMHTFKFMHVIGILDPGTSQLRKEFWSATCWKPTEGLVMVLWGKVILAALKSRWLCLGSACVGVPLTKIFMDRIGHSFCALSSRFWILYHERPFSVNCLCRAMCRRKMNIYVKYMG